MTREYANYLSLELDTARARVSASVTEGKLFHDMWDVADDHDWDEDVANLVDCIEEEI